MGGKQSRVVASEVEVEAPEGEQHEGETRASIRLTPALIQQINNPNAKPQRASSAAPPAAPLDAQQQAAFKKQLQQAYAKGAEDYRKEAEAKQKQQSAVVDQAKQAQLAKEQEARENARVAALVAELNQKNYRAPISDVQCSPERDACLQCYRDKQSDVLQCKQVADAFIRCAQVHTEKFVKED